MVGLATNSEARILFEDAVRFLIESLGAEKGIALYGRQQLNVQASHRLALEDVTAPAILEQVRSEGTPLMGSNNSVVCVPLTDPESRKVVGLVYAERPDSRRPFTRHNLKRLTDFIRNLESCLFREAARPEGGTWAFKQARAAEAGTTSPKPAKVVGQKGLPALGARAWALLFRSLATMLGAGVPVHRAVGLLAESGESARSREACSHLEKQVFAGRPLSAAMVSCGSAFTRFQIQLIRTGEASGSLPTVLNHLADHQEKEDRLIMKLKSATTYPLLVFSAALLMLLLAPPYILKGQLDVIRQSGAELPLVTKLLITLSDLLSSPVFWVGAAVALFGLSGVAAKVWRSPSGKIALFRWAQDVPKLGRLLSIVATARFARALSIQLRTGLLWNRSLPMAAACSGNPLLASNMKISVEALDQGATPSESLAVCDFFPSLLLELVEIGQETGDPAHLIEWVAEFFESELESAIESFVSMIEPLIMLFMGLIVGFMVVATMLPMIKVLSVL